MAIGIDDLRRLRVAALIHDVGKAAVRLTTPDATPDQIRDQHVQAAEKMITGIEGFEQVLTAVRYHHERADGSGFPYRVKNADIPVIARILIVANAFEEACSAGASDKDVVKDMAQQSGTLYDEDVMKALIICQRNGTLFGAAHPNE
jgi:HD-GYP domain-containing protein (c-di-GMP phosphodiesterase class II)